jgi:hypothetical protein
MIQHHYVIIYSDGRAENVKDGAGWYQILEQVGLHLSSAGSSTALANILMRDGKIIIAKDLAHMGYDYLNKKNRAMNVAADEVRKSFSEPVLS